MSSNWYEIHFLASRCILHVAGNLVLWHSALQFFKRCFFDWTNSTPHFIFVPNQRNESNTFLPDWNWEWRREWIIDFYLSQILITNFDLSQIPYITLLVVKYSHTLTLKYSHLRWFFFAFSHYDNKVKLGFQFCHSRRGISKIECLNTKFPLSTLMRIHCCRY